MLEVARRARRRIFGRPSSSIDDDRSFATGLRGNKSYPAPRNIILWLGHREPSLYEAGVELQLFTMASQQQRLDELEDEFGGARPVLG
eukprot:CAMPEP_0204204958 /NCGR_PEP_ID=MMETSP0361-20130328/70006_1 /ASSEMBLY_ACC=CAM_ASM_000343 /TAXON_ID=268821 /ORGANISM="Scrippsiella Hangoei, Strain SHTV-5" /LENGTH=87 /DNA_ID=CAMNT_0051168153 /DNA_START=62 /DNA_END=322 /DNA_ORIENTATION=-